MLQAGAALSWLSVAGLGGCGSLWRPSPFPLQVLHDDDACTFKAPVLLVLLPGVYMAPQEMRDQGMVAALRKRRLAVDVVIAGAGVEYLYDGSILDRLHTDVIAPYRSSGYRRVWLAGISLGAYVAMRYAQQHPGQIEGIVAIAPYLGREALVQEVAAAGGPWRWRSGASGRTDDADRGLWLWLAARPVDAPTLYLAHGREDRFALAHRMLAHTLEPSRILAVPGGHDWPPWRNLWLNWLDLGLLPQACTV